MGTTSLQRSAESSPENKMKKGLSKIKLIFQALAMSLVIFTIFIAAYLLLKCTGQSLENNHLAGHNGQKYLRWLHSSHLNVASLRPRAFADIFRADSWNAGSMSAATDQVTRAGPGSSLEYTERVRSFLGNFFKSHNISRVADMSCSELLWQPLIPGFGDLELFVGFDIVPAAVERARARIEKLRSSSTRLPRQIKLEVTDFVSERLFGSFDLVIVRDTFFHLPPTDALIALEHISASGSRFLGTTTIAIESIRNSFILPGEWYPLNLQKPPFSFPSPLNSTVEGFPGADYFGSKLFAIWPLPLVMQSAEML